MSLLSTTYEQRQIEHDHTVNESKTWGIAPPRFELQGTTRGPRIRQVLKDYCRTFFAATDNTAMAPVFPQSTNQKHRCWRCDLGNKSVRSIE